MKTTQIHETRYSKTAPKTTRFMLATPIILVLIIAGLFFAGCETEQVCPTGPSDCTGINTNGSILNGGTNFGGTNTQIESPTALKAGVSTKTFNTKDDLLAFMQKYSNSGGYYGGYYGGMGIRRESMSMDGMSLSKQSASTAPIASSGSSGESSNSHSTTNNQVGSVDEADIIKNDGNYIYTITGNALFIINAYPGEEAKVVSTIAFKQQPQGLFIDKDKLAVFGEYYDLTYFKSIDFRPINGMTFLNVYDISDKTSPVLKHEFKFEGRYSDGRMAGDNIYLIVNSQPIYRRDYPTPLVIEGTTKSMVPIDHFFYYPIPYRYPSIVTAHAISFNSNTVNSVSVVTEGGENLYMSPNNIYITSTQYINEYDFRNEIMKEILKPELTDQDNEIIRQIMATPNEVMSGYEKESKIMQIYQSYMNYLDETDSGAINDKIEEQLKVRMKAYEYVEYTVINKIAVDGNDIRIAGNGKVPGRIINQFSLDESSDKMNNAVLRIATTISSYWSRTDEKSVQSSNNVYALDENLKIIGQLEGLAENEQIYSTRFIGDRLYMVTFRQVDPFFAIDLSNPKDITLLGKLKIPGFSRYLHPYDANTIIGIGQDATAEGRTTGLKISLFDVSDVEHPKEVAKYVTEERYASSTALYEHKAFLFDKEKQLLVIPAYSYEYKWNGESQVGYNGAFVFKITKNEITLRGLIDHSQNNQNYWSPQVERSLWIEELLYTKSPNLLRINKIDDLSSVKSVTLQPKGNSGGIPVY